jgi:hypothetical protein
MDMKNIAVLIDFTEGSKTALKQASGFAKEMNGKLFGIHIVSSPYKINEAEKMLIDFMKSNCDIPFDVVVTNGDLISATQNALKKISAELVVICTHGVKGMFQHLFGAQILKLVQGISYTSLVIQENNKSDLTVAKKILLPVGPHPDFMIKVKQTAALAKVLHSAIVIYEINRPGSDFENRIQMHIEETIDFLTEQGIPYTKIIEDVQVLSVGFSRQTIEYASKNGIDMISQMATVSKNDILFGSGDKENFLTNEYGISILSCNT